MVTLWRVPVSRFSGRARWALDHKRVPHRRVPLLAGSHPAVTFALTRGRAQTVPVLTIGTRAVADSTAILHELEARVPERTLVPADLALADRAWALEDELDREVGPAVRLLAYRELARRRAGAPRGRRRPAAVPPRAARGRPFLVGDALSVADLTAASLLYPLTLPPEGPWVPRTAPQVARANAGRPVVGWVRGLYASARSASA